MSQRSEDLQVIIFLVLLAGALLLCAFRSPLSDNLRGVCALGGLAFSVVAISLVVPARSPKVIKVLDKIALFLLGAAALGLLATYLHYIQEHPEARPKTG